MSKVQAKKIWKRSAVLGVVVALVCLLLPPEYKTACELVAHVCTGGM